MGTQLPWYPHEATLIMGLVTGCQASTVSLDLVSQEDNLIQRALCHSHQQAEVPRARMLPMIERWHQSDSRGDGVLSINSGDSTVWAVLPLD